MYYVLGGFCVFAQCVVVLCGGSLDAVSPLCVRAVWWYAVQDICYLILREVGQQQHMEVWIGFMIQCHPREWHVCLLPGREMLLPLLLLLL